MSGRAKPRNEVLQRVWHQGRSRLIGNHPGLGGTQPGLNLKGRTSKGVRSLYLVEVHFTVRELKTSSGQFAGLRARQTRGVRWFRGLFAANDMLWSFPIESKPLA